MMKNVLVLLMVSLLVGVGCNGKQVADDEGVTEPTETAEATEPAEGAEPAAAPAEPVPAEGTAQAEMNIIDTAKASDDFKTLVVAIESAGLAEALAGPGPFTVFAPNEAAFAALPEGTLEELTKPENKEKLATILKYHVVPGKVMAADVQAMEADTLAGMKVPVAVAEDGTVTYGTAKVIKTDVVTSNGVIHVIDTVVLPPEKPATN